MKKCSKCNQEKSLEEFVKNKYKKDGLSCYCKECKKIIDNVDVEYFPAKWDEYGKSAGYKRNVEMANNADALILIWDGKSKGSGHMKNIAKQKGLTIYEIVVKLDSYGNIS